MVDIRGKIIKDLFDRLMLQIFGDIPLCMKQRDDIILGGKDREEHKRSLEKVLQKELQREIQPKEGRVNFVKEKLQFVAHLFTSEGIKPDPRKIEAVISFKEAKPKEEVRSFLRMTGYLDNFIRNYATLSAALLKNLTRYKTKFK